MRRISIALVLGLLLMIGCSEYNGGPAQNINARLHPNLAAAQKFSWQAYEKIIKAQKANGFDLEGLAQRAKELLVHANDELKLAAETANDNSGK